MDDAGGPVLGCGGVIVIGLLAPVVIVACGVIAAAAVGVALLVIASKGLVAEIERAREAECQRRLQAAQEQEALVLQVREQVERQELRRQELEKEQQQQQCERERQEAERVRQAEEEAARKRLETEREKATQVLTQWNNGLLVKQPSPEHINSIIEAAGRMQSHCGRYLHVIALVGWTGVALEWKAHTPAACVPQVIGLRDGKIMFSGWAFAGQHSAQLLPGRYMLAFVVNQNGRPSGENDLCFDIFIPESKPLRGSDHFKKAVDTTAKEFVSRAKTVAKAKRKVSQILVAEGNDPDEIAVEMSKLEVQIKDLHQEGE